MLQAGGPTAGINTTLAAIIEASVTDEHFGAIYGVSPEAYTEGSALLEEAREGRQPLHEVAARWS